MRNVKCTHLAQSRYTPRKKSDPVSVNRSKRSTLCVQMYVCVDTCHNSAHACVRERERERERDHGNATKVCPVPRPVGHRPDGYRTLAPYVRVCSVFPLPRANEITPLLPPSTELDL
ncbi:hypothetical protein ALC62_02081 [Cyphomyrmex costatus]|uniref:Uncharacterized protein n=1 Tax=Cyphomyrmex costatus TaxID=456900 RepID=A0A151INP4_9HYME|nr:hypothetical protein ALC62_02081 [Cyphomyrmex costatus]